MTPEELNQHCIEQLTEAGLGTRVAIIGSGPSSPYVAPLDKLQQQLCVACGLTKDTEEQFWNFCQRAFECNAEAYHKVLRTTYGEAEYWTSITYRHIVAAPFRALATLNYDRQLPYEFANQHPSDGNFSVYPSLDGGPPRIWPQQFFDSPPKLVALHGYAYPDKTGWEHQLILKREDYNNHYINGPLFGWWIELLLALPCIFIGTSLNEPGLVSIIDHLRNHAPDRIAETKHLHLVDVKADPDTKKYRAPGKSHGVIQEVLFDILNDRSGLMKVLSPFSHLSADWPSPSTPAPRPITATDTIDPKLR